jgi:hypothetical protein
MNDKPSISDHLLFADNAAFPVIAPSSRVPRGNSTGSLI